MARDSISHLRYLGMLAHVGHREYRFQIEAQGQGIRSVALTIDDGVFRSHRLMSQEAPDLCYQKMLADCASETVDRPICSCAAVTDAEVDSYRDSHPVGKIRKAFSGRSKTSPIS